MPKNHSLPLFTEPLPAPDASSGDPAPVRSGQPEALWLCVRLPDLPLEVFAATKASHAFAVSEGEGSQQRIAARNAAAAALGVRRGQSLNSALSLAPELLIRQRLRRLERRSMQRLAAWAGQFTSHVDSDFGEYLLLEVRRSLRLFGGLDNLRRRLQEGLSRLGYGHCVAVAPTPLAAVWLARGMPGTAVLNTAALPARLGALPLQVTGWPVQTRRSLRDLGLGRLRDCLRLPRSGFARRLGRTYLEDLDRALGKRPDPRPAWRPPDRYRGRLELSMPVGEHRMVLQALERLVRELAGCLRASQAGIRRLTLSLEHLERPATVCTLHTLQEERDPAHLLALAEGRLERLSLPSPVAALVLESDRFRVLVHGPGGLFEDSERAATAATPGMLVDRLRSRLGSDAVHGLCLVPEHRPESAWRVSEPGQQSNTLTGKPRPFWLLETPRRLRTSGGHPCLHGPLKLESGPERIESGWWDGRDVARDYYRARSHDGLCLWVFRERCGRRGWFLHGVFA